MDGRRIKRQLGQLEPSMWLRLGGWGVVGYLAYRLMELLATVLERLLAGLPS